MQCLYVDIDICAQDKEDIDSTARPEEILEIAELLRKKAQRGKSEGPLTKMMLYEEDEEDDI